MASKTNKINGLVMFSFILLRVFSAMAENTTIPVKIGVVLETKTWFGKMSLSSIDLALSDFYSSPMGSDYKTRLVLYPRDNSNADSVGAAAAALDLIKNVQVQAILGPDSSNEAKFMINLGEKAHVPIISFSSTSPSLCSIKSSYFFQATQSDASQVKAISAIIETFGWRKAVLIYVDDDFGEGIIPILTDALQQVNVQVVYHSAIPRAATDDQIVEELYKLMAMPTRVFIVHMLPSLGSHLFTKAKEIGMISGDYVWIVTNGMMNLLSPANDSWVLESMHGVLGIKTYVPNTQKLKDFLLRWKRKFHKDNPNYISKSDLNIFGLWAYDTTFALAMAVEKVGAMNFGFINSNSNKPNVSINSKIDLETFGISQNGPRLVEELSKISFRGLSGEFSLVDQRLNSSTFQIINVNGNRERNIAFWTRQNGLSKGLESTNINKYSTSKVNLRHVIWPGDSTAVPRGWVVSTNGKKLKIGIPPKSGLSHFVRVLSLDPNTKTAKATGYSIEVFEAVIGALPYAVPYEYILFANTSDVGPRSYDDLVDQVRLGNFDAAVGDITIRENRSKDVEFTLPYTQSGVSMVVQIKGQRSNSAFNFVKPLTWDLWLTSACFFVFIGFVVWILEHKINDDFRGPLSHQIGTSFWFSFSTMVFAQGQNVHSNLARFVVVVWLFVVLVLTRSYTASLTTYLTIQQLKPTITDFNEIRRSKVYVGYPKGSFVYGLLKAEGFDESKLIVYDNLDKCNELFLNGRIVAAFDEIPYMKLFTASHCSNYTMVGPVFEANGFGFVFPKNSPLVRDFSRAILKVSEGDRMKQIENKWLRSNVTCQDSSTTTSSSGLGLDSFWGLFLIAGISTSSALIIFVVMFLAKHWHVMEHAGDSSWRRFQVLFRIFNEKDRSSHTFRKNERQDQNNSR